MRASRSSASISAGCGTGTSKYYVYTKPSRKAIQAIKDKVKAKTYRSTRHQDLDELIRSLNRSLAVGRTTSGTGCPKRCSAPSTASPGCG